LAVLVEVAGDVADPGLVGAAVADWTTSFHGSFQMTRSCNMREFSEVAASSVLMIGRT
jgi:hypothetical protein